MVGKIIPPGMSFKQAMSAGYVGRLQDRGYMDWVKELACCSCQAPADDPHHVVSVGFKGMGTKVPDYWTIPLCRVCHDELHHNVSAWEEKNGPQIEHALLTLTQAINDGILHTKRN